MRLIVTGAAGFLGYHICNELAEHYDEIVALDVADFVENEYPAKTSFHKVDIRDLDALKALFAGGGLVAHAAAALPLWKPEDIYSTNVQGTRNVLEAAKHCGVERVVLVSSTAVYGVPEKHPIYEDDPLVGVGPYGESKIEAEQICVEYRSKGLIVPIIRPKTFIGTGRLGVFQILYDWVQSGKKIPIIGNGKNRYQLLEVEDLVSSIQLALSGPAEKVNDTFNVGAKEFHTVNQDVGEMCAYANSGARVMRTPAWLVKLVLELFWMLRISPLYKWVYGTADKDSFVSIEKAEKVLGWEPKYSNAQALIRSHQWYLDHKHELAGAEGVTHRVAWKQGILGFIKKFM
ncbi:MAG: NAD(P)-dependent oxidoreductase [Candidatus Alcyoniella australis]|nr:NAD(P)-dependent oxidoreductase [Candidatus Alcyoniella australis]